MAMNRREGTPFKHVVVATDFSVGAQLAAERVALLPLLSRGRVTVVHVLPDSMESGLVARAKDEANRALREATRALDAAVEGAVKVAGELVLGQSYNAIVGASRSLGADLLVVGRHGPRPFRDLFIGSTAERVVRLTTIPVLVVSGRPRRRHERCVVAVDLAPTSGQVVAAAARMVGPEAKDAVLVHAHRSPFEALMTTAAATRARQERQAEAERRLTALADSQDSGVPWESVVQHGDARAVVLEQADRRKSDLIVVGGHVRPGLVRTLPGTTAEGVLRTASCDVLVAPVRLRSS